MQRILGAVFVLAAAALVQGTAATVNGAVAGDPPTEIIAVCNEAGQIAVLDKADATKVFATFSPSRSLVPHHLAVGDFDGDGKDDVVAAADGSVRFLKSDSTPIWTITPFPGFTGSLSVAAGDVNGDGLADIVVGAGPGAPGGHVKAFSGGNGALLHSFLAFPTTFSGGVYVAAGDLSGDGKADILVGAGAGAGPHVKVFDGSNGNLQLATFVYDAGFNGGVRVAVGDVDGDGVADIITGAGPGAPGGHVKVFDGRTFATKASFLPFDPAFLGGVYVGGASNSIAVTNGTSAGGFATIRIFRAGAESQWLMPFASEKGGLTLAQSPGLMGKAPSRPQIPGKYDLKTTW
jgi:hypothetical protein